MRNVASRPPLAREALSHAGRMPEKSPEDRRVPSAGQRGRGSLGTIASKEKTIMTRRFIFAMLAVPTALLLAPRLAYAGLEACNNIHVRANATCQVEASGGCAAQCEPTHFEAACAGKLTSRCDGECSAQANVECTGSCEGTCRGQCQANPGSFDCGASCNASCGADCDAECAGSATSNTASGSCKAKGEANCGAKCSTQCSGSPPSATCEGKCKASCEGSCRGKASAKCQIDCQAKLEGSCKAELEGGCKTHCQRPDGALFCDGQYVDTGNNLQQCIDALKATYNIQVQGSASGHCSGNQCTGEAEGNVTCAASPRPPPILPGVPLLAMVGVTIARNARRGRR